VPIDVALPTETRGSLSVHPIEIVRSLGIDAFITDRFGGVSAAPFDSLNLGDHVGDDLNDVQENRRRVASALDVATSNLVIVRQVHGAGVLDASLATSSSEADALVYDNTTKALAILVADCVPILIADERSKRFAVLHAGWRGLALGIVAQTLARFNDAASVRAFIGPSISREAYQVGPEVAENFSNISGALLADGGDKSRLDLRRVAAFQLMDNGVRDASIVQSNDVTDGAETFFSDRAQRPCGRFALVAKRTS
jgi:YfiH family protein